MKLSISVYCVLLYYQKVLNYNVQKKSCLMHFWAISAECQTASSRAEERMEARLDNWRCNQHNAFWKGKKKLRHMFP